MHSELKCNTVLYFYSSAVRLATGRKTCRSWAGVKSRIFCLWDIHILQKVLLNYLELCPARTEAVTHWPSLRYLALRGIDIKERRKVVIAIWNWGEM